MGLLFYAVPVSSLFAAWSSESTYLRKHRQYHRQIFQPFPALPASCAKVIPWTQSSPTISPSACTGLPLPCRRHASTLLNGAASEDTGQVRHTSSSTPCASSWTQVKAMPCSHQRSGKSSGASARIFWFSNRRAARRTAMSSSATSPTTRKRTGRCSAITSWACALLPGSPMTPSGKRLLFSSMCWRVNVRPQISARLSPALTMRSVPSVCLLVWPCPTLMRKRRVEVFPFPSGSASAAPT